MTSPNIWTPGSAISAEGSLKTQAFIAAAGQAVFLLTNFQYVPGVGSLYVYVSGLHQRVNVDFTETSASSFTLASGVPVNTVVVAVGFTNTTISIIASVRCFINFTLTTTCRRNLYT